MFDYLTLSAIVDNQAGIVLRLIGGLTYHAADILCARGPVPQDKAAR